MTLCGTPARTPFRLQLRLVLPVILVGCALGWLAPHAFAQSAGGEATPASDRSAPASRPPASAYVDRVIDPATLSADEDDSAPDRSGWLRGIRVEQSWLSQRGPLRIDTLATSVNAFADSPNYGTLSLYGTHFWQQQEVGPPDLYGSNDPILTRASNWRLDQRALPLGGGWTASHSLGTTTPFILPMSYAFGQMPLPSSPLRGAAGEWASNGGSTRLVAASGRTGYFSGIDVNGFQDNDATMSTFGGQTRLSGGDGPDSSRLDAAVQYFDARNQGTTGL